MMRFLPIINRYHPLVVKMQTVIRYIKLLNSPHCVEPKIKNGARSSSVLQHVFALDTMEGGSIKSIISFALNKDWSRFFHETNELGFLIPNW